MPSRNLVYEALALRARESPAGDRILCLMTSETGIQDVFVFGGPKSKLRSLAAPYAAGRAFVYLDPSRDFLKLTDFEVREPFSGLRESLRKIWAAGLVAEFLIKTSGGGGDFPLVLDLSLETLRALESQPEDRIDYSVLLFLWRMIAILGLSPDYHSCASCGADFAPSWPRRYSFTLSAFLCPRCAVLADAHPPAASADPATSFVTPPKGFSPDMDTIEISAGTARWLERAEDLSFTEALRASLDGASLASLKRLCFGLARRAAEAPLKTLEAGIV